MGHLAAYIVSILERNYIANGYLSLCLSETDNRS